MLKADDFCWKILPILVIAFAIVFGSSWSKFLKPEWAMAYLANGGTDKSSFPQKVLGSVSRNATAQRLIQTKVFLPYFIPSDICLILQQ